MSACTRAQAWTAAMVVAAGCAETPPELQVAKVADLEYAVPLGWESREISAVEPGSVRVEWRPLDSTRDERLTLVVTPPLPALFGKGIDAATPLIAPMLQGLPDGRFAPSTAFTTPRGLRAVAVRGEFTPTGADARVARSHAVIEHGERLVHVIYTARSEDPSREAYQAVVDSLHAVAGGAP